jgi:hypothetical protein
MGECVKWEATARFACNVQKLTGVGAAEFRVLCFSFVIPKFCHTGFNKTRCRGFDTMPVWLPLLPVYSIIIISAFILSYLPWLRVSSYLLVLFLSSRVSSYLFVLFWPLFAFHYTSIFISFSLRFFKTSFAFVVFSSHFVIPPFLFYLLFVFLDTRSLFYHLFFFLHNFLFYPVFAFPRPSLSYFIFYWRFQVSFCYFTILSHFRIPPSLFYFLAFLHTSFSYFTSLRVSAYMLVLFYLLFAFCHFSFLIFLPLFAFLHFLSLGIAQSV